MKKIDFARTIGILANIAVLAGILLLAYELNQNRQMMRAQTRTALAQGVTDLIWSLGADAEISKLIVRGDAGEELSDDELTQYRRLTLAQFRYNENVHYQYRNGLYDEDEFAAQREAWRTLLFSQKGVVEIFCPARPYFSPAFVAEVEGLLTS